MIFQNIVILITLIGTNALIDWYRIEKLKQTFTKKMYLVKTITRVLVMAINTYLYFQITGFRFDAWEAVGNIGVQSSVFWLLFDHLLNLLRGKPFFYLGKTAPTDTAFDNISEQYILKIAYLIFTITALTIVI